MAGSMTIRELLTRYAFKTDLKPIQVLDNAVNKLKTRVAGIDQKIQGAFKSIAKVSLAGAVGFATAAVKLAADAEESEDMFSDVFKGQANSVRQWSEEVAKSMGRGGHQIREFAANLQDTFVPLGIARGEAAQLSMNMVELASDVASFKNKAEPDVINAFASALVGNHDAVRGLGIAFSQEDLKKKISELRTSMTGFAAQGEQQQKVIARYAIIMERTKDAHGNATKTAGSLTNQVRNLKAKVTELGIAVGNKLTPHVKAFVEKAVAWIDANKELLQAKVEKAIEVLGRALQAVGRVLGFLIDNWRTVVEMVGAFIAARVIFGIYNMAKGLWEVASSLRSVTSGAQSAAQGMQGASQGLGNTTGAAGKASSSLGTLATSIGAVAMAFKIGWDIGTWLDSVTGDSDKISDAMAGPERAAAKVRDDLNRQVSAFQNLKKQSEALAAMARKGVKSVDIGGGKKMELTQENVQARLQELSKTYGVGGQWQMAPELLKSFAPGPGAGKGGAPGGGQAPVAITNNVTVPPGTPETLAKRTADASGAATKAALRNAMGNVTR